MAGDYDVPAAVAASAEAAKVGLELTRDFGGFLSRVSGSTVENFFGLFNDRLKFARAERIIGYYARLERRCEQAGLDLASIGPPPPSIELSLLEAASLEDRDEIVDLWDKLLYAATNPATRSRVRARQIEVIKRLEPLDAYILQNFTDINAQITDRISREESGSSKNPHEFYSIVVHRIGSGSCSVDDVQVSLSSLEDLRLFQRNHHHYSNLTAEGRSLLSVVQR